ncbi:MAG: YigZ family protein [Bacilli bacterium]|nr:YigZ family protein [Bacilli bacterium]
MKSIEKDTITEIIINKSRFISILCNIDNTNQVKDKIAFYKKKYKDATHYCTAYIIDSYTKCDDNGEPSGTAGMPILNVLKNSELNHILCIVVRYFGGIKLGAGGLVRAYSKSASEVIKKAPIIELTNGYYIEITFNYDDIKTIDNLLKDLEVEKKFDEKIIYSFKISEENFNKIENILINKTKITKKESVLTKA